MCDSYGNFVQINPHPLLCHRIAALKSWECGGSGACPQTWHSREHQWQWTDSGETHTAAGTGWSYGSWSPLQVRGRGEGEKRREGCIKLEHLIVRKQFDIQWLYFSLWIQITKTLWIVKPEACQKHGPKGLFIIIHTHVYTSILTWCESLQGSTLASLRQGYLYPHPDRLTRTEPRVFLLLDPACDEPVVVLLPLLLLLQLLYQPRVPLLFLLLLARRLQGSTAE